LPPAAEIPLDAEPASEDASQPALTPAKAPRASLKERILGMSRVSQVLLASVAFVVLAAVIVVLARLLASTPAVQSFLTDYPGETPLPDGAPVGLPTWLGWQHFFNVFFMVLIIRTGLTVRRETRPSAYWAPRRDLARKVSITIWLHQSLDVIWLVNGAVFIVILFVTGQWMRIVPLSWDIIPNAVSAGIQYATLNWPTENGWVNYNSLQVLAYFTTVFIAAPLAAITGFRMSTMWPKNARRLNAAYPMEWARAVHFPVMLYFCFFIAVHVFLVFTTGALRNLNHMYNSSDVEGWTGFWFFFASLGVIAVAWFLSRPIFISSAARLFGNVTSR